MAHRLALDPRLPLGPLLPVAGVDRPRVRMVVPVPVEPVRTYKEEPEDRFVLWLMDRILDQPPIRVQIDLSEVNFYIPPLLGVTVEAFKAIQRHNERIGIF